MAKAYLEFLNNLPIQALFLGFAIVFGSRLDTSHIEWTMQGIKNAMPMLLFLAIFISAAVVNMSEFMENAVTKSPTRVRFQRLLRRKKVKVFAAFWKLLSVSCKRERKQISILAFVMLIIQVGFTAVVLSAVQFAISSPFVS